MRAPFSARLKSGGGYLKWAQRAWFDWINLGLHTGAAPGTGGGEEAFFLFFLWHFSPYQKKRWALELGWNVIIGQHQTRELPIKVLGYKQHLFQIGLRLEEHSLPLSLCLYHRSGTNYHFSLLFPSLLPSRLTAPLLSLLFRVLYASCSLWPWKKRIYLVQKKKKKKKRKLSQA